MLVVKSSKESSNKAHVLNKRTVPTVDNGLEDTVASTANSPQKRASFFAQYGRETVDISVHQKERCYFFCSGH
jgi:hypothetical protein